MDRSWVSGSHNKRDGHHYTYLGLERGGGVDWMSHWGLVSSSELSSIRGEVPAESSDAVSSSLCGAFAGGCPFDSLSVSDRGLFGVAALSTVIGMVAVAPGVSWMSTSHDIWDSEDESVSCGRGVLAGVGIVGACERVPAAAPMRGLSSSLGFLFLFGVRGLA